jgi:hypothetical protein
MERKGEDATCDGVRQFGIMVFLAEKLIDTNDR